MITFMFIYHAMSLYIDHRDRPSRVHIYSLRNDSKVPSNRTFNTFYLI